MIQHVKSRRDERMTVVCCWWCGWMDDDDAIADQNMTVTDVNAIVTKANEIEIDSTQKTLIYKAKNLSHWMTMLTITVCTVYIHRRRRQDSYIVI